MVGTRWPESNQRLGFAAPAHDDHDDHDDDDDGGDDGDDDDNNEGNKWTLASVKWWCIISGSQRLEKDDVDDDHNDYD